MSDLEKMPTLVLNVMLDKPGSTFVYTCISPTNHIPQSTNESPDLHDCAAVHGGQLLVVQLLEMLLPKLS